MSLILQSCFSTRRGASVPQTVAWSFTRAPSVASYLHEKQTSIIQSLKQTLVPRNVRNSVRKALRALRNLHVDPLSLHTSMRNKQVEFNPYIYTWTTLSKLYRFGYQISVFLIQNTRSLFYGRHYSSLHRLMSLHRKLNVTIFLMFIVAENTRSVNICCRKPTISSLWYPKWEWRHSSWAPTCIYSVYSPPGGDLGLSRECVLRIPMRVVYIRKYSDGPRVRQPYSPTAR